MQPQPIQAHGRRECGAAYPCPCVALDEPERLDRLPALSERVKRGRSEESVLLRHEAERRSDLAIFGSIAH